MHYCTLVPLIVNSSPTYYGNGALLLKKSHMVFIYLFDLGYIGSPLFSMACLNAMMHITFNLMCVNSPKRSKCALNLQFSRGRKSIVLFASIGKAKPLDTHWINCLTINIISQLYFLYLAIYRNV